MLEIMATSPCFSHPVMLALPDLSGRPEPQVSSPQPSEPPTGLGHYFPLSLDASKSKLGNGLGGRVCGGNPGHPSSPFLSGFTS